MLPRFVQSPSAAPASSPRKAKRGTDKEEAAYFSRALDVPLSARDTKTRRDYGSAEVFNALVCPPEPYEVLGARTRPHRSCHDEQFSVILTLIAPSWRATPS